VLPRPAPKEAPAGADDPKGHMPRRPDRAPLPEWLLQRVLGKKEKLACPGRKIRFAIYKTTVSNRRTADGNRCRSERHRP